MTATVLDGKAYAKQMEAELAEWVAKLKQDSGPTPILATILVGDDPASATYVKMKGNACQRVGMDSLKVAMPQATTTEQLLAKIAELNNNPDVHGILLQHPVPSQIDERACFDAIALAKDVPRPPETVLVNVTPQETRVAILENSTVCELHIERNSGRGLVGNIYLGVVKRVLPGMQS